jgi:hypothetical protein
MTKPTSDRDQQHEVLEELYDRWLVEDGAVSLGSYLLNNGVSVEVPPEPEVKPGTTGTAMFHGGGLAIWVRVMRAAKGWNIVFPAGDSGWQPDSSGAVTDFVPDVVLTREIVVELGEYLGQNYPQIWNIDDAVCTWAESHGIQL